MTDWEEVKPNLHLTEMVILGVIRAGGPKTSEELMEFHRELKQALNFAYWYGGTEALRFYNIIKSDEFLEEMGKALREKNDTIKGMKIELENYNHLILQKERDNALFIQRQR